MLRTRSRSAAEIFLLLVLCVSCSYKRAVIPTSATRDPKADLQCFEACDNEVGCVTRCPGAVVSAQSCDGEDLCIDQKSLTSTGKIALTVGIVAGVAVLVVAWIPTFRFLSGR